MSPLYFHDREMPDATRRFDEWRAAHPQGFYANRQQGTRWMLHRARCWHEYGPGEAKTAANPKLCDTAPGAIRAWMKERHLELMACKSCRPDFPERASHTVTLPAELRGSPEEVLARLPEHDPALLASVDPDIIAAYGLRAEEDADPRALEGELRVRLVRDRFREARLRSAKIARARADDPDNRLRCEVAACRFDFGAVYGALGDGYIQVHHLRPLSIRDEPEYTGLEHLAVVCSNCHAMIHRGGGCRSPDDLIPSVQGR